MKEEVEAAGERGVNSIASSVVRTPSCRGIVWCGGWRAICRAGWGAIWDAYWNVDGAVGREHPSWHGGLPHGFWIPQSKLSLVVASWQCSLVPWKKRSTSSSLWAFSFFVFEVVHNSLVDLQWRISYSSLPGFSNLTLTGKWWWQWATCWLRVLDING